MPNTGKLLIAIVLFAALAACTSVRAKDLTTQTVYNNKKNADELRKRFQTFYDEVEGKHNVPTVTAAEAGDIYRTNAELKYAMDALREHNSAQKPQTMTDREEQKLTYAAEQIRALRQDAERSLSSSSQQQFQYKQHPQVCSFLLLCLLFYFFSLHLTLLLNNMFFIQLVYFFSFFLSFLYLQ